MPRGDLEFFGDVAAESLYAQSIDRLTALGGIKVEIDFSPFRDAARLLYQGPWLAERLAAAPSDQLDRIAVTLRELRALLGEGSEE